jgi:hypothetical protein
VKQHRKIVLFLFSVLLGLSFLKDSFSPDFLNSPSAHFLNSDYHLARLASFKTQGMFWFVAILYSLLFVFLPYKIIDFYFKNAILSKFTLYTLAAICVSIYLMIFINSSLLDHAIIPKVNRYFHSPIIVLFFIAAFTILKNENMKEK